MLLATATIAVPYFWKHKLAPLAFTVPLAFTAMALGPLYEQHRQQREAMEAMGEFGQAMSQMAEQMGAETSAFDAIGIPAFQFMVDRLEYNSRTHHSNMDTVDRVQRDDMVQHATVIAVFAYNAAMRDEKLPRKALPRPQGRGNGSRP